MSILPVDADEIARNVAAALAEDIGSGDLTADMLPAQARKKKIKEKKKKPVRRRVIPDKQQKEENHDSAERTQKAKKYKKA